MNLTVGVLGIFCLQIFSYAQISWVGGGGGGGAGEKRTAKGVTSYIWHSTVVRAE